MSSSLFLYVSLYLSLSLPLIPPWFSVRNAACKPPELCQRPRWPSGVTTAASRVERGHWFSFLWVFFETEMASTDIVMGAKANMEWLVLRCVAPK